MHYKGSGPQMLDLAAVRVDVASGNSLEQIPLIKAGKIRSPAILTPRRSKLLPGVPTAVEQVPEFSYSNWLGFVAPATIVNRLGDAFAKTAKAPALIARLEAEDIALVSSLPAEFRQHIIKEIANWKRIVNEDDGKMEEQERQSGPQREHGIQDFARATARLRVRSEDDGRCGLAQLRLFKAVAKLRGDLRCALCGGVDQHDGDFTGGMADTVHEDGIAPSEAPMADVDDCCTDVDDAGIRQFLKKVDRLPGDDGGGSVMLHLKVKTAGADPRDLEIRGIHGVVDVPVAVGVAKTHVFPDDDRKQAAIL